MIPKTCGHIIANAMRKLQQQIDGNFARIQGRQFYAETEGDIHRRLVNRGCYALLDQVSMTWTANQTTLTLPRRFQYAVKIQPTAVTWPDDIQVAPVTTMIPEWNSLFIARGSRYVAPGPDVAVLTQPFDGNGLAIKSSNSADTAMMTIKSRDANGNLQIEQIALDGTNEVLLDKTHNTVLSFNKTITTTGNITLLDKNARDATLSTLGFWEEVAKYSQLVKKTAPSEDTGLSCICSRRYEAPLDNADNPFMDGIDTLIETGIVMHAKGETRQEDSLVLWNTLVEREITKIMNGMAATGGAFEPPNIVARC